MDPVLRSLLWISRQSYRPASISRNIEGPLKLLSRSAFRLFLLLLFKWLTFYTLSPQPVADQFVKIQVETRNKTPHQVWITTLPLQLCKEQKIKLGRSKAALKSEFPAHPDRLHQPGISSGSFCNARSSRTCFPFPLFYALHFSFDFRFLVINISAAPSHQSWLYHILAQWAHQPLLATLNNQGEKKKDKTPKFTTFLKRNAAEEWSRKETLSGAQVLL